MLWCETNADELAMMILKCGCKRKGEWWMRIQWIRRRLTKMHVELERSFFERLKNWNERDDFVGWCGAVNFAWGARLFWVNVLPCNGELLYHSHPFILAPCGYEIINILIKVGFFPLYLFQFDLYHIFNRLWFT